MPEHSPDFPFAHRLPTDAAGWIHGSAPVGTALIDSAAPRRRLAVLVLVFGLVGSGLAAGLPSGSAQALRGGDCGPASVVDISHPESRRC